jgi:hypothetical protein
MAEELVDKLRSHLTLEQQFTHRAFLDGMDKLSRKEAREVLEVVYANYLIRAKLLENIVKYCVAYGVHLPSFGDLLEL